MAYRHRARAFYSDLFGFEVRFWACGGYVWFDSGE